MDETRAGHSGRELSGIKEATKTFVNFFDVSKIDQYFGGRAWKLFPITAHHGIYR
jgi:hypothetical protein